MSACDSAPSSQGRPAPRAGVCYRETVRQLASLSERHRDALQEFADRMAATPITKGVPAVREDQLGDRVGCLEDVAVGALAHLARIGDYEDALEATQESGSAVWLWGTLLNRAVEATDVSRVSSKR